MLLRRRIWLIALSLFLLGLIGWSWRPQGPLTLLAAGDVLLDRGVRQWMEKTGDPGYPFHPRTRYLFDFSAQFS